MLIIACFTFDENFLTSWAKQFRKIITGTKFRLHKIDFFSIFTKYCVYVPHWKSEGIITPPLKSQMKISFDWVRYKMSRWAWFLSNFSRDTMTTSIYRHEPCCQLHSIKAPFQRRVSRPIICKNPFFKVTVRIINRLVQSDQQNVWHFIRGVLLYGLHRGWWQVDVVDFILMTIFGC